MRTVATSRARRVSLNRLLIALPLLCALSPNAHADEPFYEGKVIRLVVGSGPGSAYDLYSRLLAQFMPSHIPGHPTMVVQNMPGAAGLVSAGYMYNAAPRDGTVIASAVDTLPTAPLLHPDRAKFDVTRFSWIGNLAKDIYIAYVWHSAPVKSFDDLKRSPVIMGAINQAVSADLAILSNAMLGTKIKIVTGYDDQTGIKLAIERGEVEGTFGSTYSALKLESPSWLPQHKIRIILQHGFHRLPEFADVPTFLEEVKKPEDREGLDLELAPQKFSKPFYGPPSMPADRLKILRQAFDATAKDPEFLAAAAKAKIDINGVANGAELAEDVTKVAETPKAAVDRILNILGDYYAANKK